MMWLLAGLFNWGVLAYHVREHAKTRAVNYPGVVFLAFWFMALAPFITFMIVLYTLICFKEFTDDLKRPRR